MDYFEEFKKQQAISEGLFDKIFSNKKVQHADANPNFYQKPDGTFMIGKSTAKEVSTPSQLPFLQQFPWKSSKLNFLFLPGTIFKADFIDFNLKNEVISQFEGQWLSGPFYGEHFEGVFQGSSFQGDFVGNYANYRSAPVTFIDGTFLDTSNKGLLGFPDITSLHKIRNKKFNFLAIPAGHSLQFRSANGIEGYIKVLKRLDHVSSTFEYEVLDGFKGEKAPQKVSLPWSFFRQNFESGIIFIHPRSPKNIAGIIQVPDGDSIVEMHIASAPVTFKTGNVIAGNAVAGFEKDKLFSVSLKTLPAEFKSFIKTSDINVAFKTPEEYEQFKKILTYINSGMLEFDISNIQRSVQFGEVDGYGNFSYLASLFNNAVGKNMANLVGRVRNYNKRSLSEAGFKEPEVASYDAAEAENNDNKQDILSSMRRMNDFVKFFVGNIVDPKGKKNVPVQQEFMGALKSLFGTATAPTTTPTTAALAATQKVSGKTVTKGLGLKKEIRDILKNGF